MEAHTVTGTDSHARPAAVGRTSRRRLFADRAARVVVAAGGIAIIASILGILLFILLEVAPLTRSATVAESGSAKLDSAAAAVVSDEYREHAAVLGRDGVVRAIRLSDGVEVGRARLPEAVTQAVALEGRAAFAAATADGRVLMMTVDWDAAFDAQQKRTVTPRFGEPVALDVDPHGQPVGAFAARSGDDGAAIVAAQLADGTLEVVRASAERNEMTGELTRSASRHESHPVQRFTRMTIDAEGRNLFAGTAQGELLWWTLTDGEPGAPQVVSAGPSPVTALTLLLGGRSLVVGQANGAISVWLEARQGDDELRLVRVRDFTLRAGQHGALQPGDAISLLAASPRNKGFMAADLSGRLGLFYSTSDRVLWTGKSPLSGATALAFAPKADGAALAGADRVVALAVGNPHPEVTLRALFGKIWYESYPKPEYVWQSTGGSDDFEPKLSLTPLLVGTLKGTFYSLLLAIPIGVLGAMYASQFMHPRLVRVVKPTVEIMAALPSVVLGFLAGLWLAPHVERGFPGLLLMLVVLPLLVLLAGAAFRALPQGVQHRFPAGAEVFLYFAVLAIGAWACLTLSDPVGRALFGGNFQNWLLRTTGLPYDQRNAVVVGLAMGIAVIPIIFAIAEDAFSNVPRNLVAGSLALGANRWQTVTRVVLPSASPGIFSAIMIGFGRAVGETMIVLMATGNTPIMSWNPFNGFRTLSANIAVEIPEAPQGGTLYRTLFLAALLLFVLTFMVNTAAEIVRQRLRQRYSEL
ncbi:MAG: ABC transporter permease subunit [Acidobacteriota bacterium]